MNKRVLLIVFCIFISSIPACGRDIEGRIKIPLMYRVDVYQGNAVEQTMLDKLERGMDKDKVIFIMGTPLLIDPFHSNRWEYIYIVERNGEARGQRRITLFFEDDKLTRIEGDVGPATGKRSSDETDPEVTNVVISDKNNEDGTLDELFDDDQEGDKAPGKAQGEEQGSEQEGDKAPGKTQDEEQDSEQEGDKAPDKAQDEEQDSEQEGDKAPGKAQDEEQGSAQEGDKAPDKAQDEEQDSEQEKVQEDE